MANARLATVESLKETVASMGEEKTRLTGRIRQLESEVSSYQGVVSDLEGQLQVKGASLVATENRVMLFFFFFF